jgi:hypothetical protein
VDGLLGAFGDLLPALLVGTLTGLAVGQWRTIRRQRKALDATRAQLATAKLTTSGGASELIREVEITHAAESGFSVRISDEEGEPLARVSYVADEHAFYHVGADELEPVELDEMPVDEREICELLLQDWRREFD